jgi:Flp pilus assembly protein TadG
VKRVKWSQFRNDESAAVAPTIALSLFALIAVGGIGFDYARMMAMDSELQNAADQAALAAATQLDGEADARSRATTAAQSLVTNSTLFSNDDVGSRAISMETDGEVNVFFYSILGYTNGKIDKAKSSLSLSDADANFVEVTTTERTANFALTPIVAAISSATLDATAWAGVGSSICNVPPVMICNPQETNTNLGFDATALIGTGINLVSSGNGGGAWAPGNFGYLDTGSSVSNPIIELKQALGWEVPPGDCVSQNGVKTRTGAVTPVTDAINTRFDIYGQSGPGGGHCPTGGACPPSINSVKDLVRKQNAKSCNIGPNGWQEPLIAYSPISASNDLDLSNPATIPTSMGHPRDKCHAVSTSLPGACSGPIGNGNWDRNAYFRVNYKWTALDWQQNTLLDALATRYQVYQWEIENRNKIIGGRTILARRTASGNGVNSNIDHDAPVCSPSQGYGNGQVPGGSSVDRRIFSTAVINCLENNVQGGGGTVYPVKGWLELFLVEPSATRNRTYPQRATGQQDVYVEVIRETQVGSGAGTVGQVVSRNVPYLIE